MGGIEHGAGDLGAQLAEAKPTHGSVGAQAMLSRVLEGVLQEPAEPLRAGRYVILDAVGRGGLGEVYAAYDPELDRKVAIKLVRADVPEWGDLDKRMLREAQAMAKIRHANVVAIYDVGRFREQVFIAMELIEGATLSAWSRETTRDWSEVRDIFVQAARGLAAVHAAGLVQRDFKPANVLVGRDGVVKVLDFGLARAVAGTTPHPPQPNAPSVGLRDEELTQAGVVAGTPAYMAPEQWTGTTITAATDQFAFCVALHEALWGARPFPGNDLDLRLKAIAQQAFTEPAGAPSIPAWLRRVVHQGLALQPAQRHTSMDALVTAMQQDRRRRNRTWLAVGVATVLSAAATSAAFAVHEPIASAQQLAAIDRLVLEAREAAASHYFVYPPLDDPTQATAYSRTLALDHIDGPAADAAHAEARVLRAEFSQTLFELGEAYAKRDGGAPFAAEFFAAAVLFDASNEDARRRSLMTSAQLASLRARVERHEFGTAELITGASLAALAEPDKAVRRAKVATLQAQRTGAPASTMASLDTLLGRQANTVAPPATTPKPDTSHQRPDRPGSGALRSATPVPESPKVPRAEALDPKSATRLVKLGLAALNERKLDRAETLLNQAIAKNRKSAAALGGLATVYFELGRYADAVTYAERAVTAAPKRAKYQLALGDAYFKVLRYTDAQSAYSQAQRLGAATAQRRLDRVAAKLGSQ